MHFPRFRDLTLSNLDVEWHVHTSQTDGQHTIHEILQSASAQGLRCVAFTEHVRRDTKWFQSFASSIREHESRFPAVKVLVGCEAKALGDGELDVSVDVAAECDIVLGSVHRFPDGFGGTRDWSHLTLEDFARIEFDLALDMIQNTCMNVLAHPGGMSLRRLGDFPNEYFAELIEACIRSDKAIEISTSYLVHPEQFLALCSDLNPKVSIGSDVHRIEELGRCSAYLKKYIGRQT